MSESAEQSSDFKITNLAVGMTCEGCAGAVKRILGKIEGIKNVETDVESKLVKVTSDSNVEEGAIVEALMNWSSSTGKSVALA
mmetsp:Transcript_17384/g.17469  ORF Transcript_17384/g.17469 Transcript_17384/m.17469 type:complete len:83 (+) Transcript_17384:72-320(+)|eukprot:CAMPEP_0182425444 /NCGR_PEP_ID=MMETSP1167-20130531/11879_1 /TAXON_ID=2988 /ORGANISM="Mallomonas Sp, Strain CCMP3275" /LENGTH=82 /DNA_ID=CAMNT_0024606175 /DNA_START=55 /DNA_END=303 /DNA_ORIENTATION=+